MIIGILKETRDGETRVAAVPETVMKYAGWDFEVMVESDAGIKAGFDDDDYIKAGALVYSSRGEIFGKADIILKIWGVDPQEYALLRPGQIVIADFESGRYPERLEKLAATSATVLGLEKMPRISRAQSMDVLSSQNNIAGYKAALLGINSLNRGVPLMITSAGTISPAKALVLGAGVAGLQAIATLKRMGAVIYASDVRAAAKEQVESLGGRFLVVEEGADFEGRGGYANEITPEYLLKQQNMVAEQLKQTDILITTALSASKKVPLLVNAEMLKAVPENAVVIDMADGNVDKKGARSDILVVQDNNLAALIPNSASRLFARNILNLIDFYGGKDFKLHLDDEIMAAICICYNGKLQET